MLWHDQPKALADSYSLLPGWAQATGSAKLAKLLANGKPEAQAPISWGSMQGWAPWRGSYRVGD